MKIEFTPGPWNNEGEIITDQNGFSIMEVHVITTKRDILEASKGDDPNGYHTRPDAEVEANIRLAKKAPQMIDLLNRIVQKFEKDYTLLVRNKIEAEMNEALQLIVDVTVPPPVKK